jgi:hypothetical protein
MIVVHALGITKSIEIETKNSSKIFIQWVQQARKSKKCPRNSASGNPQNFQRFVLKVMEAKSKP